MLSTTFLIKIILAPAIIAGATRVARKWGESVGGLIVGLPLTSAPVSVFFYIEQGPGFAQSAAKGALMGMIPVAVFCLGYVTAACRLGRLRPPWSVSALAGVAVYAAAVTLVAPLDLPLGTVVALVIGALALAQVLAGRPPQSAKSAPAPRWDLPLRMLLATAMLLFVTTAAGALGPTWSGLLSPFPIFTFVMATFSHHLNGPESAWRLIRGVLGGLFSYTAFFWVVGALILTAGPWAAYPLAALAAVGVNAATMVVVRKSAQARVD